MHGRGWTTKTWTNKRGEPVRGSAFTKGSLYHMLRNPVYRGLVRAGDELYDGAHGAIIDEVTWDAVQSQLREHGQGAQPRRSRSSTLLAGLVRCGTCGSGMTAHHTTKGNKRYPYYVCQTAQKEGASACPGSRVAAGKLETFVLDRVREIGRDPKVLEATLEADRREHELRRPDLAKETRRLVTERTQVDGERNALVDAIAKAGKAAPALAQRLGEKDEELRAVERRHKEVHQELAALDTGAVDADELHGALEDLEPVWGELSSAERARILALLIEEIEYDAAEGQVAITFRPGGPAALQAESEDLSE